MRPFQRDFCFPIATQALHLNIGQKMPEHLFGGNSKCFVFQTVFEEYQKIAGKSIEDSIKSETKGSLEDAMLAIGKRALFPFL